MRFNLIILLFLFHFSSSFGQVPGDSTVARKYYQSGESFYAKQQFDSSIFYFKKALDIYEKNEDWKNIVKSRGEIAKDYMEKDLFNKSLENADIALEICKKHLPEDKLEKGNLQKTKAISYSRMGEYQQSIKFHSAVVDSWITLYGEEDARIADAYLSLAFNYYDLGDFHNSLKFHKKALKIQLDISDSTGIGTSYSSMANLYFAQGKYDLANEYSKRAINIRVKMFGKKSPKLLSAYNTIANINKLLKNYDYALEYHDKAIDIALSRLGNTHTTVGTLYINKALTLKSSRQFDSALEYIQLASEIYQSKFGESHPHIAIIFNTIAGLHREKFEYELALEYFQKELEINHKFFGEKHFNFAFSNISLGETYEVMGQYDLALDYYQKALIANSLSFDNANVETNPPLRDYFQPNFLLQNLEYKGRTLLKRFAKSNNSEDLDIALRTYQKADTLISIIRQSLQAQEFKLSFANISTTYLGAMKTCLLLADVENDNSYLERAFYFTEKGRAAVLRETISDSKNKKFSQLPEEVLALEVDIKKEITTYQSQMISMKSKPNGYDTAKLKTLEGQFAEIRSRQDSLNNVLRKDFPAYFQLKYNTQITSVSSIQKQLNEKEAVLEFLQGDSTLYSFVISKNDFTINSQRIDTTFDQNIQSVRSMMMPDSFLQSAGDNSVKYNESIRFLSDKLLKEPLSQLNTEVDHLTIIPSGKLGYLPFEILPIGLSEGISDNNYLLRKYSVVYGYSSTLLFDDFYQKGSKRGNNALLAFSPSYETPEEGSDEMLALGKFRSSVAALKWNKSEVEKISNMVGGKQFTGLEASERKFKELASQSSVIHLAMHALIDDEDPMNSRLVFAQDNDSISDGFLHAYELYNMNLSSDMVVLSACETGVGTLEGGEGIMSLARAFSYAGCPSIVMSHWQVNDESTARLMELFYKNLGQGKTKSVALREAKLAFLDESDELFKHPFYWGSFVVIGEDKPIQLSSQKNWIYWLGGALGLLILLGVFRYLKK